MRADHYSDPEPSSRSRPRRVTLDLPDLKAALTADAGVFSSHRVDAGTEVLLTTAPPPPAEGDLLDLGAGYGPIAVTLASRAPEARVWAVDVNQRALGLVRENAAALGLSNIVAALPDEVPPEVRFAAVYSNPPVKVGKAALHELLERWLPRLAPGAPAYLVVNRNLGSDSLADWLLARGHSVSRLRSKRGYRVLEVRMADGTSP